MNDINLYQYKVGTLIIDLIDLKENQAVWHGAISGTVEYNMKNVEKKINSAVKDIFDRFQKEASN